MMSNELRLYDDPWISELYDSFYAKAETDRDAALWQALAEQTGGSVLELACGTGRVLLTCDPANVASARIIERNGGILQDVVTEADRRTARYWIAL